MQPLIGLGKPSGVKRCCAARTTPAFSACGALDGAGAAKDSRQGLEQDLHIEPEGALVDVLRVEGHPLFKADVAAAHHLPEAGDAGFDAEATTMAII